MGRFFPSDDFFQVRVGIQGGVMMDKCAAWYVGGGVIVWVVELAINNICGRVPRRRCALKLRIVGF